MNLDYIKETLKNIKRTKFGISIPELRKFAKRLAKARENYIEFLENNDFSSFELKMLHAFLIGYINDDINFLLKYFEDFIPYVDNWAINDSLCQNFKIAKKYPSNVWNFLMKYKNTKKEFESRIVSVMLLSHFLNDVYIDKVFLVLNNLNSEKYYAKMGIAWNLATVMSKYPEKCLNFLKSKDCNLDKQTFNKTIQKIIESNRINKEIKFLVKDLRRI